MLIGEVIACLGVLILLYVVISMYAMYKDLCKLDIDASKVDRMCSQLPQVTLSKVVKPKMLQAKPKRKRKKL